MSYAKDNSNFLLFPAFLIKEIALQIDGNTVSVADSNNKFNAKVTDQNVILSITIVNFDMQASYRTAVYNAFINNVASATSGNIISTSNVGSIRGRLATPSNQDIISEELVFFSNKAELPKRYPLGEAELTALQNVNVDEIQFFIDITYRATFSEDAFRVKLSLVGNSVTQLANKLVSTSGAAAGTQPKYLIGIGGSVQASGNGLQDIKTAFQLQVLRNANIPSDQSEWATQMVNNLLTTIPGVVNNFDVSQHTASNDIVTFLIGNSVKITAPFNELDEIDNKIANQTDDELKTDFENSLKNNTVISGSAKGSYGPFSGDVSGSSTKDHEESAKNMVEAIRKNQSSLEDVIKGKITNIAAIDVSQFQNFVNSNSFTSNVAFANFQDSTAVSTFAPFSLLNTFNEQLPTLGTPIGTVTAYVGSQIPTGWLLCDGRPLNDTPEYHLLYTHPVFGIGQKHGAGYDNNGIKVGDFNLPDYRGYFLRGLDTAGHADPDVDKRSPMKNGGNVDGIGSVQQYATAKPTTNVFATEDDGGKHGHYFTIQTDITSTNNQWPNQVRAVLSALNQNQGFSVSTGPGGDHIHTIRGGDLETRPKNAYVYWIIKYQ